MLGSDRNETIQHRAREMAQQGKTLVTHTQRLEFNTQDPMVEGEPTAYC